MNERGQRESNRRMLWVDAVGGYLVCLADQVTLGQPIHGRGVDVPILGDLSGRHARIVRDGESYLLEAIRDARVDGRSVERFAPLREGSRIELGSAVKLVFRRPHPLSATARLEFASRHRTQPTADAVLLMADSCILGPNARNHVVCRRWPQDVLLFREGDAMYCRTQGEFRIDGHTHHDCGPVGPNCRIEGEGFSMNLESM